MPMNTGTHRCMMHTRSPHMQVMRILWTGRHFYRFSTFLWAEKCLNFVIFSDNFYIFFYFSNFFVFFLIFRNFVSIFYYSLNNNRKQRTCSWMVVFSDNFCAEFWSTSIFFSFENTFSCFLISLRLKQVNWAEKEKIESYREKKCSWNWISITFLCIVLHFECKINNLLQLMY